MRPNRGWERIRPTTTGQWITLLVAIAAIVIIIGGFCTYGAALFVPEEPEYSSFLLMWRL